MYSIIHSPLEAITPPQYSVGWVKPVLRVRKGEANPSQSRLNGLSCINRCWVCSQTVPNERFYPLSKCFFPTLMVEMPQNTIKREENGQYLRVLPTFRTKIFI